MMTLKSLELIGFKSFGRKSQISFSSPITGVVGPNGSGKSNIVESIRFVLGEQSIKSLRGKGGSDLIFKGSKTLSASNRASVFIVFDNKEKNFSFTNSGSGVSVDYDEISIGREVFADGSNRYSINGSEVRLKDILDLLSSVNIGSSGHHIISQGEADRVLNASNKDRKAMIEDALGLRVYQYRIKEAERKLEKTLLNIKEVQSLRREIAPHLNFLKKQVQVFEKAKNMREELKVMYRDYLSIESTYIKKESLKLKNEKEALNEKKIAIEGQISKLQEEQKNINQESVFVKEIQEKENNLVSIRSSKSEFARSLGRIEGILEGLNRQIGKALEKPERVLSLSEWQAIVSEIESKIDEALQSEDISLIVQILNSIKSKIKSISESDNSNQTNAFVDDLRVELENMTSEKNSISENLEKLKGEEDDILREIEILREKDRESRNSMLSGERLLYELMGQKSEIVSKINSILFEEEKLGMIKSAFENELTEAGVLIGREIVVYASTSFEGEINRQTQEETRRKIERIKIKLEDTGSGNGDEVMKEYSETEERDNFLAKELEDLKQSMDSLKILIQELRDTLDNEFKEGVNKINQQFNEFFSLMFGGGKASLSVTMEYKKPRKQDEIVEEGEGNIREDENDEDNELGFERGIEIDVTLPQKKVKDLNMLSGGERSLTSIALLFAISQVNPPPFLVLDETDAALDEANSRKYGDMLENLSKYSQLVLVTHNRETMSRAQVLYGITMGGEGVSKLLSIHLEDATTYAK